MSFITYQIILTPEEDKSAYNVLVPNLPEIATFGETVNEALTNAKEAIQLSVEGRLEDNLPLYDITHLATALGSDDLINYITVEIPDDKTQSYYQPRTRQRA